MRRRTHQLLGLAFGIAGLAAIAGAQAQPSPLVFRSGFEAAPVPAFDAGSAARFLTQATFGPTPAEIERLRQIGPAAWLDQQLALPPSLHMDWFEQLVAQGAFPGHDTRVETWFKRAVQADDQLRQRVAFALSQILVISDRSTAVAARGASATHYYDLLVSHAFGNYRELLEAVTLHPAMGVYLSMLRNQKADPLSNIRPDENFARELMQLFSIGLVQLQADGQPLLQDGRPLPTYDQDTIRGFARVFTGWIWTGCPAGEFRSCDPWELHPQWWLQPMSPHEAFHETASKQLLRYPGVALADGLLPAGGDARADLEAALDNLFEHPNVGPFLARRLIQRLTTSNPSPAYVQRVAAAFDDDGSARHERGNLQAVVRAILLDPEARDPAQAPPQFGKLREPLLRMTQLWRAFDGHDDGDRFREFDPEHFSAQAPLRSPSVFNFFLPDFVLPGELGQAGLVTPELQISTDSYLTRMANEFNAKIALKWRGNPDLVGLEDLHLIIIDLEPELPHADDPAGLVARYALLFMGGRMSNGMRTTLIDYLSGLPLDGTPAARRRRVTEALWLILTSPEYLVEP